MGLRLLGLGDLALSCALETRLEAPRLMAIAVLGACSLVARCDLFIPWLDSQLDRAKRATAVVEVTEAAVLLWRCAHKEWVWASAQEPLKAKTTSG